LPPLSGPLCIDKPHPSKSIRVHSRSFAVFTSCIHPNNTIYTVL
jgi:hypothetical protein